MVSTEGRIFACPGTLPGAVSGEAPVPQKYPFRGVCGSAVEQEQQRWYFTLWKENFLGVGGSLFSVWDLSKFSLV